MINLNLINSIFYFFSYNNIFYYSLIVFCIILILLFISILFSKSNLDFEKISIYECGYEAFNDTQHQFDIRYFIVGLIFILFDIELMFLYPWITILHETGLFIFFIGFDFLIELAISFFYAWQLSIFDWK